ncbi:MAG: 16S rRNA (adenine(1518)-N(6)/adenine(1519)-N(6))-dimethyltransferase RsmA [Pseudomonadota bacterium]|nr:16S rRNA (adenine(1518)-N(6)/adenine(1519)-N(6))-dimethyltransferase RsmA [Pseudomonadota bacterium]
MIHPATRLRELETRARRRFGQNFLVSDEAVDRIVYAAALKPGDHALEIGPGLGVLTERMRATGADVHCIEIDRDLAAALRELWPDLQLVEADAMHVDLDAVCPGSGWKVIANLPYNVATPLLLRLLNRPDVFSTMVLMFQREVGDRLQAGPSHSSRGSLSVQVQVRAKVRPVLTLPPGAFFPAPKVHSVVLGFELLPEPDFGGVTPRVFDRVVRLGFKHRRKTLLNSLGSAMMRPDAQAACDAAGIDPRRRAETLDLPEWRRLAAAIDSASGARLDESVVDEPADDQPDTVESEA